MQLSQVGVPAGVLYSQPFTEHSNGAGGAIVSIEGPTAVFTKMFL